MKVDDTIGDVILEVARKLNIDKDKVLAIMTAHTKGITKVIEEHVPFAIKVDYFGSIIYNNAHKAKLDEIRALKTPIKVEIDLTTLM